jgi:hypothetical protein
MTRRYNCYSCTEPLEISAWLQAKLVAESSSFRQTCAMCGAIHRITAHSIDLVSQGARIAKLSEWYSYPIYKPHRVGLYRVKFSTGNIAKSYFEWTGDMWRNGPIIMGEGSITEWQGLGGDMEHLKTMPYLHDMPLPNGGIDET